MAAEPVNELNELMKSAGVSHYMKTNATHIDMVRTQPTHAHAVQYRSTCNRYRLNEEKK